MLLMIMMSILDELIMRMMMMIKMRIMMTMMKIRIMTTKRMMCEGRGRARFLPRKLPTDTCQPAEGIPS